MISRCLKCGHATYETGAGCLRPECAYVALCDREALHDDIAAARTSMGVKDKLRPPAWPEDRG